MRRTHVFLILGVVLYGVSLLWLSFGVPFSFPSPDENANFVFARSFRAYGTFAVPDGVTQALDGLVHPRSAVAVGPYIVPGSFLGLPLLAGMFGRIVGDAGMQYLTPLLLVAALVAWWDLMRRMTGSARFASLAAVLAAVHPAVWYYAARPMMHNVGFVAFLMLAAWAACAQPLSRHVRGARPHVVELALAGLFLGLALIFRTSEVLWIGAAVVCVAWRFRAKVKGLAPWIALVLFACIPLAVNAAVNADLYGSPFVNGYTVEDTGGAAPGDGHVALAEVPPTSMAEEAIAMLFPFGIHEMAILKNVWNFGMSLYPWVTALAAAGIVMSLRDKKGHFRMLAVLTLALAAWLGVVYGSWSFNDNPDPAAVTLGDSHVRYWLPLFVLSTIFAARAVGAFARTVPMQVTTAAAIVMLSAVAMFGGDDGLLRTRTVLSESAAKREAVLAQTETDAIIVVDRADKFLWPYRHVIQPLRSEENYAILPEAASLAPLYYFGIPFPPSDLYYLNNDKLASLGLRIDFVTSVGDEALYRMTPVE